MKKIIFISLFIYGLFACSFFAGIVLSEVITRPEVSYTAGDLTDPFLNESAKEGIFKKEEYVPVEDIKDIQVPSLVVNGLIWGGAFPQAIINNKVLKVGDTIEGARIKDINKDGVTMLFSGKKFSVSVSKFLAPNKKEGK